MNIEFFKKIRWLFGTIRRIVMMLIVQTYFKKQGVTLKGKFNIFSLPICHRHKSGIIEIGENVTILNKLSENLAGIHHRSVLVARNSGSRLIIGNNVKMSGVVLFCENEIVIGDDVNIGVGVKVYDTDFHPLEAHARRIHDIDKIKSAPVFIGEDAWIGAFATVLKGVTVGKRAVVAAHAVVVHDVPDDCMVGGVPAKIISTNIQQA